MASNTIYTEWNGDEAIKDVERAIEIALYTGINAIEGYAKKLAPVDTGNLRSSLHTLVDASKEEAWLYTDVGYAPNVEFGTGIYAESGTGRTDPWTYKASNGKFYRTKGSRPQPFMRPAIDDNFQRVQKLMQKIIKDSLARWSGK